MPVVWNLRGWLKERGITRASEVRRIVQERTGYPLSIQAVCDLLNSEPKMVRIETSQALCDAFYCRLSDFFEVKPGAASSSHRKTPRPPNPLSAVDNPNAEAASRNSAQPETPGKESGIDFASFFPDARKLSSDPSTER